MHSVTGCLRNREGEKKRERERDGADKDGNRERGGREGEDER